jgi:regulator of protease activity HflC (stomatin/prohibitin superfamily)
MSWLVELFDRLLSIIPRLILIRAYECGIKFKRGGRVVELKPGLHMHWPLFSEVSRYPTARTTMNLPMQTLQTCVGPYVVSAAVVYEMKDPVKAYTENYDIDDTISDIALLAVAEVVSSEETDDLTRIAKRLTHLTRRRLKTFGVRVERCSLTDMAPCRVIRNVCDVPEGE